MVQICQTRECLGSQDALGSSLTVDLCVFPACVSAYGCMPICPHVDEGLKTKYFSSHKYVNSLMQILKSSSVSEHFYIIIMFSFV